MFQCYVEDGYLDLDWSQRSVDIGLGLPINIASYALLQHLLAAWTGLKPRYLSASLKDVHIYENHLEAITTYINNPEYTLPELALPKKAKEGLDSLLELTALDFKDCLKGYQHAGIVKAPLSVG
jgi:thymidylate synthase